MKHVSSSFYYWRRDYRSMTCKCLWYVHGIVTDEFANLLIHGDWSLLVIAYIFSSLGWAPSCLMEELFFHGHKIMVQLNFLIVLLYAFILPWTRRLIPFPFPSFGFLRHNYFFYNAESWNVRLHVVISANKTCLWQKTTLTLFNPCFSLLIIHQTLLSIPFLSWDSHLLFYTLEYVAVSPNRAPCVS